MVDFESILKNNVVLSVASIVVAVLLFGFLATEYIPCGWLISVILGAFGGISVSKIVVKYLCTRNNGTALSHNLSDLVGIYVELI